MNFALPPHQLEYRNSSLREQVIARIMQLHPGIYTKEYLQLRTDHTILSALESAITYLADRSANDAWEAGFKYAMKEDENFAVTSQEEFDIIDEHYSLIPEQDITNYGGSFVFVCKYAGVNFYSKVGEEDYLRY